MPTPEANTKAEFVDRCKKLGCMYDVKAKAFYRAAPVFALYDSYRLFAEKRGRAPGLDIDLFMELLRDQGIQFSKKKFVRQDVLFEAAVSDAETVAWQEGLCAEGIALKLDSEDVWVQGV
jgi:hypothetical protein